MANEEGGAWHARDTQGDPRSEARTADSSRDVEGHSCAGARLRVLYRTRHPLTHNNGPFVARREWLLLWSGPPICS